MKAHGVQGRITVEVLQAGHITDEEEVRDCYRWMVRLYTTKGVPMDDVDFEVYGFGGYHADAHFYCTRCDSGKCIHAQVVRGLTEGPPKVRAKKEPRDPGDAGG